MIPSSGKISTPPALPLRSSSWLMAVSLLACAWTVSARQYTETLSAMSDGRVIKGRIDWTNGTLTVFGEAAAPADATNPARRRLAGFRAARETARRNLAGIAREVPLDSRTKVGTAALADDGVRMELEALIEAARVDLDSRQERAGLYRLALKLELRGRFSAAVLADASVALPPPGEVPAADSLLLFTRSEPYTGLVVDARGTGMSPCLAPRIVDASGRVIYSAAHAGRNCAVYDGVAGYERDLQRAAKSPGLGGARARPLVVEAEEASGTFKGDVQVSRDAGTRILMADIEGDFLSQCGVVFVLGPKPEPMPFVLIPDTTGADTATAAAADSAGLDSAFTDSSFTAALTDSILKDSALMDSALTDSALTDSALTDSAAADPYDLQLYRLLGTGPPLPPLADSLGYGDFDELFREAGSGDVE